MKKSSSFFFLFFFKKTLKRFFPNSLQALEHEPMQLRAGRCPRSELLCIAELRHVVVVTGIKEYYCLTSIIVVLIILEIVIPSL